MYFLLQRIRHFLISNSRHGTHSPFVYALADQAIYNKQKAVTDNVTGSEIIPEPYRSLISRILHHLEKKQIVGISNFFGEADVLFVDAEQLTTPLIDQYLTDQRIIIINKIHRSKKNKSVWENATRASKVTVSIDLLHFGILVHRSIQVKEDFVLRYPYWIK
ncbi:hypothetical protein ACFSQ3_15115 [Sphingobacterium corticis]|uniref:Uncharacterized protein n=1 Tax=Sphingobacterium corticis TaxID=1812823 RepID=A0ABW5NMN9_9SPHI